MAICSACFGSGQLTCQMCNGRGTGRVRFDRSGIMEAPPCGGCGGRRYIRCSGCGGTGQGLPGEARGIASEPVVSPLLVKQNNPLLVKQNKKASAFIIIAALFVCFGGILSFFLVKVLVIVFLEAMSRG